jgi:hypothetical protein|tara:strand:+ start:405 stop:524 length:120 start_codon:yes stop_codon:yes gene_type:complete
MAKRYGVLPTTIADSDVENIRVFNIATEVETKVMEKERG